VQPHDAALRVLPAAAHVVLPRLAVGAHGARAADCGDDEISGLPPVHFLSDLFHDSEVFVAKDQELVTVGRLAVHTFIDFRVGAAQADPEHLDRDLIRSHLRIRHLAHMDAVPDAWLHDDCFHYFSLPSATLHGAPNTST
jgi:hypothetical protein